ncbi:MAG: Crp/Fnr family transcriptional regulator [Desulfuromonadales bacterium]|nr:Crp/Fnr family transcriptional regulator [Desulfuromonadales bacterium]
MLLAITKTREAGRGELLFEEGQKADGFFVVVSGKIKVFKLSPDGRERILHVIQPGNSFADAAIFADGAFPAFAMCIDQSTLLFFPRDQFLGLLHRHPQLAINMIAGLSRFLRNFASQIEDLTFRDVPARLARFLVSECEKGRQQVTLTVSKAQLASNLGTTSETLSRTLRKLADEGLIAVQGRTIKLLDINRLDDLVDAARF